MMVRSLYKVGQRAGVVQWQNGSFPSCIRGFDSLRPLQYLRHPRFALTIHAGPASKIPARRRDFFALCQSQAAAKIGIRCTDPEAQMMPDMAWGGMQWQNSLVGLL